MTFLLPHAHAGRAETWTGAQGLTATRDGLYTAGYLGVSPMLQQLLTSSSLTKEAHPTVIFVGAGMAAGLLAASITQPVDTIKTRGALHFAACSLSSDGLRAILTSLACAAVQAAIDPSKAGESRSALSVLRHVHQTTGLLSLWAGFAPRAFRIMCASVILQVRWCCLGLQAAFLGH